MNAKIKQDLIMILKNTDNLELGDLINHALLHNDGILAAGIIAEQADLFDE